MSSTRDKDRVGTRKMSIRRLPGLVLLLGLMLLGWAYPAGAAEGGTWSIDDVAVTEGDSGTVTATFTITFIRTANGDVAVTWTTGDGTATTADADYLSGTGTVSVSGNDPSYTTTISVTVNGDTNYEVPDEFFYVNLSDPDFSTIDDSQGVGTIVNDDDPPEAPTITCPDDVTVTADPGQCSAAVTFAATATGSPTPTITYSQDPGTAFPVGTTPVAATAANGVPPDATCRFTVTVVDNEPPVLENVPTGGDLGCNPTPPVCDPNVTAKDNCDALLTVTCEPGAVVENGCLRTQIFTYSARDLSGNPVSETVTYTWKVDTTAPVISTLPGPSSVECPVEPSFTTPTVTDECDPAPTLTFNDVTTPGTCPQEYSVTRTWTATDACGNSSTASQTITVTDNTPPTISVVVDPLTVQCGDEIPRPTVTDACDPEVDLTFADEYGSCNNESGIVNASGHGLVRDMVVTGTGLTAKDINRLTLEFEVSEGKGRGEFTLISPSGEAIILVGPYCDGGNCEDPGVYEPTFYSCSSGYPKWNNASLIPTGPGHFEPFGGDASTTPNEGDVAGDVPRFNGTYVACFDVLTGPMDGTWTIYSRKQQSANGNVTFLSVCLVPGKCPGDYVVERTWTATDDCGNRASATQTIMVVDTEPPVFSEWPCDVTVQCSADVPPPANVTATDACDGPVSVTFTETQTNPGDRCYNAITRTWTASDRCGNTGSCRQTIVVSDTTPPVLTGCPSDVTVQCDTEVPPPVTVTASDACDGPVPAVFIETQTNPGNSCHNVITRTWTAEDDCGNADRCVQIITVADTTPPVLSGCPSDVTLQCGADVPPPPPVTASDACDGPVPVQFTQTETNPGNPCNKVITRTWTATDRCDNIASCTQIITIPPPPPTAATLSSFQAMRFGESGALLTWTTLVELDTLGFHLERAAGSGGWERVTPFLIPAEGLGSPSHHYRYEEAKRPSASEYRLVAVDLTGLETVLATATLKDGAMVAIERMATDLRVTVQGVSGTSVAVETTKDVVRGPWAEVGGMELDEAGRAELTIDLSTSESAGYYRARQR